MRRCILTAISFCTLLTSAVVLDRVAVIVGRRVVKVSDIDRGLRVSQFLNREPLALDTAAKKKAAERLIDQELIRQEVLNGSYRSPSQQEVTVFLQQLTRDRFGGSSAQLQAALTKYGLSMEQLRQQLIWQLTVLSFIDQRFRPGVLVTDEDVRAYYEEHRAALEKGSRGNATLQSLEPKIRDILVGERVNENFEEWLTQTKDRTRIEFKEAAFGDGTQVGLSRPGPGKSPAKEVRR